jgi:hypothetical protein
MAELRASGKASICEDIAGFNPDASGSAEVVVVDSNELRRIGDGLTNQRRTERFNVLNEAGSLCCKTWQPAAKRTGIDIVVKDD